MSRQMEKKKLFNNVWTWRLGAVCHTGMLNYPPRNILADFNIPPLHVFAFLVLLTLLFLAKLLLTLHLSSFSRLSMQMSAQNTLIQDYRWGGGSEIKPRPRVSVLVLRSHRQTEPRNWNHVFRNLLKWTYGTQFTLWHHKHQRRTTKRNLHRNGICGLSPVTLSWRCGRPDLQSGIDAMWSVKIWKDGLPYYNRCSVNSHIFT